MIKQAWREVSKKSGSKDSPDQSAARKTLHSRKVALDFSMIGGQVAWAMRRYTNMCSSWWWGNHRANEGSNHNLTCRRKVRGGRKAAANQKQAWYTAARQRQGNTRSSAFFIFKSHGCLTSVFTMTMCHSRAVRVHWWASCCCLPVAAAWALSCVCSLAGAMGGPALLAASFSAWSCSRLSTTTANWLTASLNTASSVRA